MVIRGRQIAMVMSARRVSESGSSGCGVVPAGGVKYGVKLAGATDETVWVDMAKTISCAVRRIDHFSVPVQVG